MSRSEIYYKVHDKFELYNIIRNEEIIAKAECPSRYAIALNRGPLTAAKHPYGIECDIIFDSEKLLNNREIIKRVYSSDMQVEYLIFPYRKINISDCISGILIPECNCLQPLADMTDYYNVFELLSAKGMDINIFKYNNYKLDVPSTV